jgi:hypothetical protein
LEEQQVAAILFLAASATFTAEWVVEGRVVGIRDGDTITVLDDSTTQHKIRIAAIDAPENGQAFGERSKQSLSALVFQNRVEARCHKKDRYGREVCAVFVSLRDVGLEQIRLGMALQGIPARAKHARAARLPGRGGGREGGEARAMAGSEGDAAVGVQKDTRRREIRSKGRLQRHSPESEVARVDSISLQRVWVRLLCLRSGSDHLKCYLCLLPHAGGL